MEPQNPFGSTNFYLCQPPQDKVSSMALWGIAKFSVFGANETHEQPTSRLLPTL